MGPTVITLRAYMVLDIATIKRIWELTAEGWLASQIALGISKSSVKRYRSMADSGIVQYRYTKSGVEKKVLLKKPTP